MLAALPYFGLALALLVVPIIEPLFEAKSPSNKGLKGATLISVVLLAGSIAFSLGRIGHASRDEDTLHDVYLIGGLIPSKSIVSAPSDINGDWAFRFYLIRHFDISIDPQDSFRYDFVIKHLSDTLSMVRVEG